MSATFVLSPRSHGVLLSRLVWPTTILFAVTLFVVFTMILWTSDSANRTAAERERVQLTAAIEQRLDALRGSLAQVVARMEPASAADGPAARFGRRPAATAGFDGAFLVAADGRVLAGAGGDPAADQIAYDRVRPAVEAVVEAAWVNLAGLSHQVGTAGEAFPFDLSLARLVAAEDGVLAVAAVPVLGAGLGPDASAVAVAVRRFGADDLKRLADLHAIDGSRLQETAPGEGWMALPVHMGRGEVGAFVAWRPDRPGDVMRERLVPLTLFGSCVALALFAVVVLYIRWLARDLARSQEHAQRLVGRDALSGLPNRLLFAERLDQELGRLSRSAGGLAVLFLDLDRFKDVNDTYGHQAGDDLLKAVAGRLAELLRAGDTLARFGGDEFAVIQTDIRTFRDAESLAKRVLDSLTHPFDIAGAHVTVGVSVGIALAPEDGSDRETLMGLADTALYQAKSEGRNRFRFFERRMDDTIRMRKVVEDDLRQAIGSDELALHYQPLCSADGRSIVGVEALVRWPHPSQGLISPARFIAIAEERGLVIPLGEWVLRRACEDGKRWPNLRIAVNVSAVQFRHRDFVKSVKRALADTGFPASRLELELTEGVVVEDADAAESAMAELHGLGVHLALDDFGTGYSSLIYLRRFAFDKIKIDRSFLESLDAAGESAILVHSIVHLGRALGLTVTAEGVETREQHRFLQALGCHQLQGYLFSKPVPREEIDRLLAAEGSAAA